MWRPQPSAAWPDTCAPKDRPWIPGRADGVSGSIAPVIEVVTSLFSPGPSSMSHFASISLLLPEPHSNVSPHLPLSHQSQGLKDFISPRINMALPTTSREKPASEAWPGDPLPPCSGDLESPQESRGTKDSHSPGQKAHSTMFSASPFTSQQRGCRDINIHVRSSEATADSRRFRKDSLVMRRQHPTASNALLQLAVSQNPRWRKQLHQFVLVY